MESTTLISVQSQARAQFVQHIFRNRASAKSLLFPFFLVEAKASPFFSRDWCRKLYHTLAEVISFLRTLTCCASFSIISQELVRGESQEDSLAGRKGVLT
jgi:hypothetical protein